MIHESQLPFSHLTREITDKRGRADPSGKLHESHLFLYIEDYFWIVIVIVPEGWLRFRFDDV